MYKITPIIQHWHRHKVIYKITPIIQHWYRHKVNNLHKQTDVGTSLMKVYIKMAMSVRLPAWL